MSDPVGGREAEIEAVARALQDFELQPGEYRFPAMARAAIAALDVVRSSGPAAQNQEAVRPEVVADMLIDGVSNEVATEAECRVVYAVAARSPQDEDHET